MQHLISSFHEHHGFRFQLNWPNILGDIHHFLRTFHLNLDASNKLQCDRVKKVQCKLQFTFLDPLFRLSSDTFLKDSKIGANVANAVKAWEKQ